LKNISVEVKISHDQIDWLNSLEEELMQIQEDLSFYNNILGEFMVKDIILLELNSMDDITQESSAIMITADAMITVNIITDTVIMADMDIANDSCI